MEQNVKEKKISTIIIVPKIKRQIAKPVENSGGNTYVMRALNGRVGEKR